MADLPGPVARLDQYLATTTLAHEVIWRLRRSLIALERDDDLARQLLAEAAALVVDDLPRLLREARRLRALWDEQELLDPDAASKTVRALEGELERVASDVTMLRTRQNEIARELRRLLEGEQ
jgi:hypothetical protein